MPKIFISYGRDASHGQNLATEAQQQLQSAGFEVFRDVIGLKPGDIWYSKLELELESSDLVVLIVSERIRKSEWVHNEISMAKEIGLPIIPVVAELVRIPLWLRHLQVLDFSNQVDWKKLIEVIDGAFGATGLTTYDSMRVKESRVALSSKVFQIKHDQFGQYTELNIKGEVQCFRLINAGIFLMGSPDSEEERETFGKETQHLVTISDDFWLADTACTQALWGSVTGENPSHFKSNTSNPVECVSWDDIQGFLKLLNSLFQEVRFSLPTEAQWEYACRAGTNTPFSFGKNISADEVNYNGNLPYAKGFFERKQLFRKGTVPVSSLPANRWGLYEMHGNVWEWCCDGFQNDLGRDDLVDPVVRSGGERVARGGSWNSNGRSVKSANRGQNVTSFHGENTGFRLILKDNSSAS